MKKIILSLLLGMFLISLVIATTWNTFTTGLTEENISFSGTESHIRNLTLPDGTYLINGSITLTALLGYPDNASLSINGINVWNGSGGIVSESSAIADYNFDRDLLDSTSQNNDATNIGTTNNDSGRFGQARQFDGTDDRINISLSDLQFTTQNFSINMWIYPLNNGETSTPLAGGSTGSYLINFYSNDGYRISFGKPGTDEQRSQSNLSGFGSWYMITIVYDQSNDELNFYLNGTPDINNPYTYSTEFITNQIFLGWNNGVFFEGTMDEITFWNSTLTDSNVVELWANSEFRGTDIVSLTSTLNDYLSSCTAVSGNCTIPFNFTATNGNLSYSDLLFTNDGFIENSNIYNSSVWETDEETITLNLSYDTNRYDTVSAILKYNGSNYAGTTTCTGNDCLSTTTIDIPLVEEGSGSETKNFYWSVTLFDTTGNTTTKNSTTQTQTVKEIKIYNCSSGSNLSVNFNIFKESDQTALSADFDGSFDYFLGSGSVYRNETVDTTASSVSLCVNSEENFKVNSNILLDKDNYDRRRYNFVEEIYTNTSVTNKSLYLLNSSAASDIIIEVRDEGLQPYPGLRVVIEKYLEEENKYIEVESQITDVYGQFTAKLEQNDIKYKFYFYNSEGNLLKTSEDVRIICRATICVLPFVIEEEVDVFDDFDDIPLFTSELSFDNTTNTFTYSWDDQTGSSITIRLEVTRYKLNGSEVVCDTTSTSSLSSLSCNVGSQTATYKAQAFRSVDGGREVRIALLSYKVGDAYSTYGVEGVLWVFILLFTCIGIGAFNPTIGIGLYGVGFIFMGMLGIISMPIGVFVANTLFCVLFIWSVKT